MLDWVALQEEGDREIWRVLGVADEKIVHTGSLKIDPLVGSVGHAREEFRQMLSSFGVGRPIVLAASTHVGEEVWLAKRLREMNSQVLPVMVPRHAERREEVRKELEAAGYRVSLRSQFRDNEPGEVMVIDSTGELKDWIACADVVVIGKSFLAKGGQNPVEAVLAGKPVVFGEHMENFEPLSSQLAQAGGARRVVGPEEFDRAIHDCLDAGTSQQMVESALRVISKHQGATDRILGLISVI